MNTLIVMTRSLSEVLPCGCALVRLFSQEFFSFAIQSHFNSASYVAPLVIIGTDRPASNPATPNYKTHPASPIIEHPIACG
jgi:hypothetical protein